MQPDIRDAVVDFTTDWSAKTELPADQLIAWIGIQRVKYCNWKQRYGKANGHNGRIPPRPLAPPIERQAILDFHDRHPLDGYRRLTTMMVDRETAA